MPLELTRIRYTDLNPRQKENYNYQKLSAVLADYGFVTMRLSDDWQGADFIAQHIDGEIFLKVQLKSRLTFCRSYVNKNIHVAFRRKNDWYIYLSARHERAKEFLRLHVQRVFVYNSAVFPVKINLGNRSSKP